jgi:hypothetical protein
MEQWAAGGNHPTSLTRSRFRTDATCSSSRQPPAPLLPGRFRGDYQVKLNHGVSKLCSGKRRTVRAIFHDAA